MEREKICADSHCEAQYSYAIVRTECEPHQSILGNYEGSQFKVTNVRNEATVWKVFCRASGKEKFVDYVWPYFICPAPKTCPLLAKESTQPQKKSFLEKIKESFKK